MSTSDNFVGNVKPNTAPTPSVSQPKPAQSGIPQVVKVMQSVKTDTPEAKLNKITISDGNGGRITLDDQTKKPTQAQNSTILGNLGNEKF